MDARHSEHLVEANENLVMALLAAHAQRAVYEKRISEISRLVNYDRLTDLPNRKLLQERFEACVSAENLKDGNLALMFLDLDHFKEINDCYGHTVGDAALVAVGNTIKQLVRSSDTVSRYGGDEFVILINNIKDVFYLENLARKIQAALSVPLEVDSHFISISVSIGISVRSSQAIELDELITLADKAMYSVKTSGRGNVEFSSIEKEHSSSSHSTSSRSTSRKSESNQRCRSRRKQDMELSLLASSAVEKEAAIQRTLRHQIEFMATLVHELRNPLGPILHAANLICVPHQKADTLQNMHQIIERQVNHISRLLEDVFDISRISSGKMQLVFEKINLSVLLNEIVEFFKIQTLEVGPLISFDLIKTPIFVLGDNVRLTQIFSNLLDNARKYTPQSGKIVVSVEVDDLFIVVTIADTGIGMSPDALNHIFDMFVQESEAMSFNGKGLGIGLALVQELIHAHGGSVTADSKGPNLGSTFKLSLPRLINIEG